MDRHLQRYGYVTARVMLAAIFLLTGYDKLVDVEDAAGDIAGIGLPFPTLLAVAAGLVEIVCGAFLALGRWTDWAAAGLLLFLVPVTVLMENPLRADADFGAVIDFLKNLAIMGGLLLVVLAERRNVGISSLLTCVDRNRSTAKHGRIYMRVCNEIAPLTFEHIARGETP